ncbi:hypothetical protein [Solicola gregarius]|uniref:Uncharacterized protein n=1 Tax=Solicola gregarius TaxID=2908642 RepID=A0AA46YL00_9ACTN|nr:hypothetical protein [Solicola gregarius]UYM05036.1 hypothetical protein L0C25_21345 [Solicola gregarius]
MPTPLLLRLRRRAYALTTPRQAGLQLTEHERAAQPEAGLLFRARPGFVGLPASAYAS